jgi:hypothetical protein
LPVAFRPTVDGRLHAGKEVAPKPRKTARLVLAKKEYAKIRAKIRTRKLSAGDVEAKGADYAATAMATVMALHPVLRWAQLHILTIQLAARAII